MSPKHLNIFLFVPLVIMLSCLEPFQPEIPEGDDVFLVVDGVVTDKPGPYTIKVTESSPLSSNSTEVKKITGLNLFIEVEDGITEELTETEAGTYQTYKMLGEVGKHYRLIFEYEGDIIQSAWEKINSSSLIDSVYYNLESKETAGSGTEIPGVQFYVDSRGTAQDALYYRYEWEETWEIGVSYASYFDYIGNDQFILTTDPRYTCWKYNNQSVLNIGTTAGLSENFISEQPLAFITGEEERFTEKYSLLVKQYGLSEDEYDFWRVLKETNEDLGSLFDKQPGNIPGNLINLTSPSKVVLGYFSASGLEEKRVFVEDFEELSVKFECVVPLDTLTKANLGDRYEDEIQLQLDNGKFFFDFITTPTSLNVLGVFLSPARCSDCQRKGGDLTKPIYWDE